VDSLISARNVPGTRPATLNLSFLLRVEQADVLGSGISVSPSVGMECAWDGS
jgi:hypothetical protein